MNNSLLILPSDYPFKSDVIAYNKSVKESTQTVQGVVHTKRITIEEDIRTTGWQWSFAKVFKNTDALRTLSSSACRLLIDIAINIQWESPTITLHWKDSYLSKPVFYESILELIDARIISKKANKKEVYWVNVMVIFMGTDVDIDETKRSNNGKSNKTKRAAASNSNPEVQVDLTMGNWEEGE